MGDLTGVRFEPYKGFIPEEERQRVRATDLYKLGDTVLVWVNEGDLYMSHLNAASPPSPTLPSRERIARLLFERGRMTMVDPPSWEAADGDMREWLLGHADAILALFTPPEPAPKPSLATVEVVEWK